MFPYFPIFISYLLAVFEITCSGQFLRQKSVFFGQCLRYLCDFLTVKYEIVHWAKFHLLEDASYEDASLLLYSAQDRRAAIFSLLRSLYRMVGDVFRNCVVN